MRRFLIPALLAAALVTGCGGGSDLAGSGTGSGGSGSGGGGSGGGSGGGTKTTLSMGNTPAGGAFQANAIGVSPSTQLSAGGTASLSVSIVDQTGALYTQSTQITFNSTCVSQQLATIVATPAGSGSTASASVTTTTGTASAIYTAAGCSGTDTITASASANGQALSATATVTVAKATVGAIQFISATPAQITLKGVGSAGGSQTSTVIFKVVDSTGGPVANQSVTFALNTSVGGITISSPAASNGVYTAQTGANGQVQAVVTAGTVATTVRVTATTTAANGTQIATESNALTVSTGIPTSANVSLAVKCPNVEAWSVDGVTVPVTVRMTDRFSNPVPDGTTAQFQTTLGGIDASCQTGSAAPGSGTCSVNWVSKAPRMVSGNPQTTLGSGHTDTLNYCTGGAGPEGQPNLCNGTTNGRSPIIVTAIGEESFKDANGSGVFSTTADTVAWDVNDKDNDFSNGTPKPWFDTSEPFLNEFEIFDSYGTPTFFAGEPFIDFNNNGKRDGPDGLVQSALCQGSLCATGGDSVAIYADNIIVMSGSTAYFAPDPASASYQVSTGTKIASITVADVNNQQMPAGTTVAASLQPSTAGTVGTPATFTWPCTSAVGGETFQFVLTPPTTGFTPGFLIITVTTPGNVVTTARYAVN